MEGRVRNLGSRRFCLTCSPFGSHNTSSRPLADTKVRRRESWVNYSRNRRIRIKAELLACRDGRCEDCGYDRSIWALEFHHRDSRDKQFALGGFLGSLARARTEAAKCFLICANCHRARHSMMKTRSGHEIVRARQDLKQRAVAAMGGACVGCGFVDLIDALEFHHIDPTTKEFGISTEGIRRGWKKIAAELAKCVLLCANCHREVHAGARRLGEDEGSYRSCAAAPDPLHKRCA